MNDAPKTPAGTPVPPQQAPAQPDKDGLTDGKGNPVASIASSESDAPLASQTGEALPINTTGLGANAVEGNSVGGRQADQGVPAGVVERVEEQKKSEE